MANVYHEPSLRYYPASRVVMVREKLAVVLVFTGLILALAFLTGYMAGVDHQRAVDAPQLGQRP